MTAKKSPEEKAEKKPKVWKPEYVMETDGTTPKLNRKGKKIEIRFYKDGNGGFKLDADKNRIPIPMAPKKDRDIFLGVVLGELPGDFRVNEHGQLILDELILLSEEPSAGTSVSVQSFVTKASLATLRTQEFYDRLQAVKESSAKMKHVVMGWLSSFRKVKFIVDLRGPKPRSERKQRHDLRPVAKIKTKEEIRRERGAVDVVD